MGALRFEVIPTVELCGQAGFLKSFRVYLDCWQVRMWITNPGTGFPTPHNWMVSIGGGAPVNVGAFINAFDSITGFYGGPTLEMGGFVHQVNGEAVAANFNTYMEFTPIDTVGENLTMTIVRVYYDEGVVDPDFPG